jgi:hypothetical protein
VIYFALPPANDCGMTRYDTAGTEAGLDRRLIAAAAVLIGVGGLLGAWRQTKQASRAGAQAWRASAPAVSQ